jgi:hypothetical protein
MGQMQRRNRLWKEIAGRARFRVLVRGWGRVSLEEIEAAAKPVPAHVWLEGMAAKGVTFWFDPVDDAIKAQAFA